jgi:hypothetical protein
MKMKLIYVFVKRTNYNKMKQPVPRRFEGVIKLTLKKLQSVGQDVLEKYEFMNLGK